MPVIFYVAGLTALFATALVITRANAFHAVLYLILAQLAIAIAFFALGAPFAAALQVVVYAGAIMVLFVFVIMMLNLGQAGVAREHAWLNPRAWGGPTILTTILLVEFLVALNSSAQFDFAKIGVQEVGYSLFGPFLIAVELSSLLLMGGLVAAYHVGRQDRDDEADRR